MMAEPTPPTDPMAAAMAAAQQAAQQAGKPASVVPIRAAAAGVPSGRLILSAREFLADATRPRWLIGTMIQRGYLYALTAPTNAGKTAVSLVMAVCIAAGRRFAGLDTDGGRVLILCGENQEGFKLRLLATMQLVGVTIDDMEGRIDVVPYSTGLATIIARIAEEAKALGDLSFVLVDTSVSFFSGVDENNNTEAFEHARTLRMLCDLPGGPAVMANCHPKAGTEREGCVPRGGSAFLNEIDCNLVVWSDGDTSELHWIGKKRGPDFDPIWFEYRAMDVVQFGDHHQTIVAVPIGEGKEREIRQKRREQENRVLYELYHSPSATFSEWAHNCGFLDSGGKPMKSKVFRVLDRLKGMKLVNHDQRNGWHLTPAGKKEAESIR